MKQRNSDCGQRGFTLTELMISLVLGLFVIGGVLSALLGGLESFRTTDSLSRMQESGRFALELLRRDIRQAGYSGCRTRLGEAREDYPVVNTLNPGPSGTLNFEYDFEAAIVGYEATGSGTGSSWIAGETTMPAASSNPLLTNPRDDGDILVLVTVRGLGGSLNITADPSANQFTLSTESDVKDGDIVMIASCDAAAVTQIATAGTTGQILNRLVAAGTPGNATLNLGTSFNPGAEVFPIERVAYYLANSPVTGRPSLFRNGVEIAEDVEDFQVEYGVDTGIDRRIDLYMTAADVMSTPMTPPPPDPWENVLSVRVSLRISSGEENNLVEEPVELDYPGATFIAPADDLRLHQVFTSTISIRNRLE